MWIGFRNNEVEFLDVVYAKELAVAVYYERKKVVSRWRNGKRQRD